MVNRRWGVLYPDALALFKKAADTKPSKKLCCLAGLAISPAVRAGQFKIRKQHRSTVMALVSGAMEERQLVRGLPFFY